MKPLILFKTTIPPVRKSIDPVGAGFLILLLLAYFGLAPMAQAVGPDTGGAIPGSNNGEGIGVLVSRTSGIFNTGTGFEALSQLTAGNQNTATGLRALFSDTNGGFNTATGVLSLFSNTSGFFNSAAGAYSLANNTDGSNNTANGYAALFRNTADNNTATGFAALYHNIIGEGNTANGFQALLNNNIGLVNTATGNQALLSNTIGNGNTANGSSALVFNTTGNNNIALGINAGINLTTGNDNIVIGNDGGIDESGTIRIGRDQTRAFISGIRGVITGNNNAVPVLIDSLGQLGTASSSRRFKNEIKPMEQTSEAILGLKPVTFHYKSDSAGTPQFGLIAEEVAEVNPDLVVHDGNGEIYTVRYEAVNAMLLNEFLKEHRKVEKLTKDFRATVARQQKEFDSKIACQQGQIEGLSAGLQRVSAQLATASPSRGGLEVTEAAPQTVFNK